MILPSVSCRQIVTKAVLMNKFNKEHRGSTKKTGRIEPVLNVFSKS
jgi:hypothetical protein